MISSAPWQDPFLPFDWHVSTSMLDVTASSFVAALYVVAYSGFAVSNYTQPSGHSTQFQLITPEPAFPAQLSCCELSRPAPKGGLIHRYAPGLPLGGGLCGLHGQKLAEGRSEVRDALRVGFGFLKIRWGELDKIPGVPFTSETDSEGNSWSRDSKWCEGAPPIRGQRQTVHIGTGTSLIITGPYIAAPPSPLS